MTAFLVDALLEITIFILVSLLKTLEMVELGDEVAHLVLKVGDFAIALRQLLLLALQVVRFLVDQPVKFFNLVEAL